jgi:hypothetical protein
MKTRLPTLTALALALCLFSGCAVTDAAIRTAEVGAAGNDRYAELATKALAGEANMATDGLMPVSPEDLSATPDSVKVLVSKLLGGLHANRVAFHSITFQLNAGPDPETLGLKPVAIPSLSDDDLLEDSQ